MNRIVYRHIHSKTLIDSENGASLLELAIFGPLALIILFALVDTGLSFTENAAVSDAIRSGLNFERLAGHTKNISTLSSDGSKIILNTQAVDSIVQQVARRIFDNIRLNGKHTAGNINRLFKVGTSAVQLMIDPHTGKLRSYSVISASTLEGSSNFSILNYIPEFPLVTRQSYLDSILKKQVAQSGISPYAQPLSGMTLTGQKYFSTSILLYVEVQSLTRGINRGFIHSLLGKYYGLQKQDSMLLRIFLK